MTFSQRCTWSASTNPWVLRTQSLSSSNEKLLDLSENNPTKAGFTYDDSFYSHLGEFTSKVYNPESLGLPSARQAIADYYQSKNITCGIEQICLCSGSSEAYAYLFLLLCNPGDCILVPRPGYPLIEIIAGLHQIRCIPYDLFYDDGWVIDRNSVLQALSDEKRIQAIIAISPHHPTSHTLSQSELNWLNTTGCKHDLAIVIDEVFAEYPLLHDKSQHAIGHLPSCLSFALSGLSKAAALPQLKLSWCVCFGPQILREAAIERLDTLADSFLSTNQTIQCALPFVLSQMPAVNRQIRQHLRSNYLKLKDRLDKSPISLLKSDGGWVALLRLPQLLAGPYHDLDQQKNKALHLDLGTAWALYLLEQQRVLVQPGEIYDLIGPYLVVSLLSSPDTLVAGIDRIIAGVDRFLLTSV